MTGGKGAGSILAETDEEWHYRVAVISFAAKIAKISRLRSNKTNLIGDEAV